MERIVKAEVHRLVVVDDDNKVVHNNNNNNKITICIIFIVSLRQELFMLQMIR